MLWVRWRSRQTGPDPGLLLNFACGSTPARGFENSDVPPVSNIPGIRHIDLDQRPLPYPDDSARVILISHGLAARTAKREILAEFARILKPGGWLRIDDSPYRFWVGEPDAMKASDLNWGVFPEELLCSRDVLMRWLDELGFGAAEIDCRKTRIPARRELRRAILGNRSFHESMTVEAVKRS